jgi:hypothetical protein
MRPVAGSRRLDCALQPQHGLDERLPRRIAESRLRRKDRQLARFPAVAAFRPARRRAARHATRRAELEQAAQARLIVLHLRQQVIAGRDHAFDEFYGMARPSFRRCRLAGGSNWRSGSCGRQFPFWVSNVCSLVGLDASGKVVLRRGVKRETLIALAAKLPP